MSALLEELWHSWRGIIDASISEHLKRLPADAVGVADYIAQGGKRLRGFLTILVARELGVPAERALDAAVAVELVHAASLALDDIIDGDIVRRGKPAAWTLFGVPKTVMVSNLLIPYAQKLVLEKYGERALRVTIDIWLTISEGEVMDAFQLKGDGVDPSLYEVVAKKKTGSLFKLAVKLGAMAAERYDLAESLGVFGEELGVAYQLADDIVDAIKGKNEPGLKLFMAWSRGSIDHAAQQLAVRVRRSSEIARRILGKESLLTLAPSFMVKVLLAEAGAKYVKLIEGLRSLGGPKA